MWRSGGGAVWGWQTETQKPQPPFRKNKPVLFESQLVHYTTLTSGSFPCQSRPGHTVSPSGGQSDLWNKWWPTVVWPQPQVQLLLAYGIVRWEPNALATDGQSHSFLLGALWCFLYCVTYCLACTAYWKSVQNHQPPGELLSKSHSYTSTSG